MNRWEERARSVKAAKLARVVEHILAYDSLLTVAAPADAPPEFRARCARLAQVHEPSEQTWATMIGLVRDRVAS